MRSIILGEIVAQAECDTVWQTQNHKSFPSHHHPWAMYVQAIAIGDRLMVNHGKSHIAVILWQEEKSRKVTEMKVLWTGCD